VLSSDICYAGWSQT